MSIRLFSNAGECKSAPNLARYFGWLVAALLTSAACGSQSTAATLKVLHEFTGPDGSDPTGGLVVDPNTGTLYGTTKYGGTGNGTVFSLTPPAPGKTRWKLETIYTFPGGTVGAQPETGLAFFSANGHSYLVGTTHYGSYICNCGTIFSLQRLTGTDDEWTYANMHDFHGDGRDGSVPNSAPFVDPENDYVYGTTGSIGGASGTLYRMRFSDEKFLVIYNHNPGQNKGTYVGDHLQGVVVNSAGGIFGTAFDGDGSGTVFHMDDAGAGNVLHAFSGPDGAYPMAPPVLGPDGSLYGTTFEGGDAKDCPNSPGCGTVWKRSPGGRFKVLHSFRFFTRNRDGMSPMSPLALDPTSLTLYGTTYDGGTGTSCGGDGGSCGTIFQIDGSGNYLVLWEFPRGGPAAPIGQLALYAGELYGTSYDGGKACPDQHYIGCGTVWKLTP